MASSGAIRAGRAYVEFFADADPLMRGMRQAEKRLQTFGQFATRTGLALTGMGTAAALPIAGALKIYADFEDQLSKVKAVTVGTAGEFEILRGKAKELGRTTSFTATQVAAAMVELGRMGFNRREIDESIAGVLDLARATDTEIPLAAQIAGATLRQFQLPTSEASRVMDVLTVTANQSAQTLEDLGEGLKPVGPIAAEAGESLEDVAAAVGVLANNGIRGSLAGNALARAYKNLANTSFQKVLRQQGVEAVDAAGNMRPLATIIEELGEKTRGMGNAQKLDIFEQLFGRGQAAALKLASSGASFKGLQDALNDSAGVANRTAVEMDNNLGGTFRRLLSAAEGVVIVIGESLAPVFASLEGTLTGIAGILTQVITNNAGFVRGVLYTIAGVTAAGAALVTLGVILWSLSTVLGVASAAMGILGAIVGAVLAPVATLTAAVGALGAVVAFLTSPLGIVLTVMTGLAVWAVKSGTAMQWLTQTFGPLMDEALVAVNAIKSALTNGDLAAAAKVMWATLNLAWVRGTNGLWGLWSSFQTAIGQGWLETTRFIADAWDVITSGLKQAMNSGLAIVKKALAAITNIVRAAIEVLKTLSPFHGDSYSSMPDRVKNALANQDKFQEIDNNLQEQNAAIRDRRDDAIFAREQQHKQTLEQLEAMNKANGAEQRLADAMAEFNSAIAAAQTPTETSEKLTDAPPELTKVGEAIAQLAAGSQAVSKVQGKAAEVGSFSSEAGRMFASGVDKIDQDQLIALQNIDRQMGKLVKQEREARAYGT